MRVKTSVTLPEDLLTDIDRFDDNHATFLDRAARQYISRATRAKQDARDAEITNQNADRMNAEASDVLEYQGWPD